MGWAGDGLQMQDVELQEDRVDLHSWSSRPTRKCYRGVILRVICRSTVGSEGGSKTAIFIPDCLFEDVLIARVAIFVLRQCLRRSLSGVQSWGTNCGQLACFSFKVGGEWNYLRLFVKSFLNELT